MEIARTGASVFHPRRQLHERRLHAPPRCPPRRYVPIPVFRGQNLVGLCPYRHPRLISLHPRVRPFRRSFPTLDHRRVHVYRRPPHRRAHLRHRPRALSSLHTAPRTAPNRKLRNARDSAAIPRAASDILIERFRIDSERGLVPQRNARFHGSIGAKEVLDAIKRKKEKLDCGRDMVSPLWGFGV